MTGKTMATCFVFVVLGALGSTGCQSDSEEFEKARLDCYANEFWLACQANGPVEFGEGFAQGRWEALNDIDAGVYLGCSQFALAAWQAAARVLEQEEQCSLEEADARTRARLIELNIEAQAYSCDSYCDPEGDGCEQGRYEGYQDGWNRSTLMYEQGRSFGYCNPDVPLTHVDYQDLLDDVCTPPPT